MRNDLPKDETLRGYARVSTSDQSADMQVAALIRAGVGEDAIYVETVSGASKRRPQRELLLRQAREGDTIIVWKLDRWGRSALDIYETITALQTKGVRFRSLQDSLDFTTPAGKLMFGMLAIVAEFERDMIRDRIRAGMRHAKANGRTFGAKRKLTDAQLKEVERKLLQGRSMAAIARDYGVSAGTIRNNGFRGDRLAELRTRTKGR